MTVEWRPIANAPGYEVSSLGEVRSVDRSVETRSGLRFYSGKTLSQTANQHGHRKVPLRSGAGRTFFAYVHALVASAFLGPRPEGMEVAHWDGDPSNNRATNLRYATPGENAADKLRHGTARRRAEHPAARLTERDVAQIRAASRSGRKQADLAREFGVSRTTISAVVTGRSWPEERQ